MLLPQTDNIRAELTEMIRYEIDWSQSFILGLAVGSVGLGCCFNVCGTEAMERMAQVDSICP